MRRWWLFALPAVAGCLARPHDVIYNAPLLDADALASRTVGAERAKAREPRQPLQIPGEFPGASEDPPKLPPSDDKRPDVRNQAVDALFPAPIPLEPYREPATVVSLADLQGMAASNHPQLRQAAADLVAARGAAVQAGLHPNPSVGYESDTFGSGRTAGQQGGKVEQVLKTAGKLQVAQAAAEVDVQVAELALRAARIEVAGRVRAAYFNWLVARLALDINTRLSEFLDEITAEEVRQLKAGSAATHEALQARALSADARATVSQSRIRLQSAWRQIATAVGQPDLPPAELAGSAEVAPPLFHYAAAKERVRREHTDVVTAELRAGQGRLKLRLAQLQPIPDIAVKVVVQKDFTTPPFGVSGNLELGVPMPVFDRNQGNIQQAQGQLARAIDEAGRSRLDLLTKLADAFERYEGNRALVDTYRREVLADLVRAYRGVYERYQKGNEEKVNFNDVVLVQQLIDTNLATYLTNLQSMWAAVVDIGNLLQTDDLYVGTESAPTTCGVLPMLRWK